MKKIKYILLSAILSISTVIAKDYYIYVAAESEDEVALIRFDGKTAHVEKRIPVGYGHWKLKGPTVFPYHQMENIGIYPWLTACPMVTFINTKRDQMKW